MIISTRLPHSALSYADCLAETDDEDDGLTPAERDILERNTLLNDASDREDYDLKDKVEKVKLKSQFQLKKYLKDALVASSR